MGNYLPNLNTPSLSKPSLMKWFLTKEWLSFIKGSSLKHIPWQSWSGLLEHFQRSCIQIMTSTNNKTGMNWLSNLLPKCQLWRHMLTEPQWGFQSSSLRKTMDTWKISFTWCSQTPCQKSSKSQTKLSEHWKLSGFVTLTMNKMHPLQLSELQEVHSQILLHALRQVSDRYGDLIMVEPMKLFSRCWKKSLKKT